MGNLNTHTIIRVAAQRRFGGSVPRRTSAAARTRGLDAQNRSVVSGVLALALAILAAEPATGAFAAEPATDTISVKPAADAMVVTSLDKARFEPMDPAHPDAQMAVLSGDYKTGPSVMLMRWSRDSGIPHIHTSAYHLTVIEGRLKHWDASSSEAAASREAAAPVLSPGGWWFQPGGKAHADSCLSDRCLVVVQWAGPRDRILIGSGK